MGVLFIHTWESDPEVRVRKAMQAMKISRNAKNLPRTASATIVTHMSVYRVIGERM